MKPLTLMFGRLSAISTHLFTPLQSTLSVAGRLYVSWVFFASGLTKTNDWETTLFLFEYEYHVPLLPFALAACLATIAELLLPVLISLGIISRLSALGLGIVNVVAVISLEEIAPAALYGHVIWGLILLHITVWGAGKLSLDNVIIRYNRRPLTAEPTTV
ncbi:DoxX family protein [uncultured Alteromonas sp.]|uniref:DoxX family protein n=1 Tax=uncultured Alteromonas sp. TaxID=179113 RepID=UPI0025D06D07|nr:DoxX family protein [uncultured Alteromonas sp.]